MLHLSRLVLPLVDREVQRLLADPYRQHQAIAAAFPAHHRSRILFRVEPEAPEAATVWLVQSEQEPDWKSVQQRGLTMLSHGVKRFDPAFRQGQRLRFRLRANPTVKREGKRHPVIGDEALTGWVQRKLVAGGAVLGGVTIIPEGPVRGRKAGDGGTVATLTLASVRFEGVFNVDDPSAVVGMLHAGIGSGKAFGFGLLSVARAG